MKLLKTIIVIGLILTMTGFADARTRSSRRGRNRQDKGGLKGIITQVGTYGFTMTLSKGKSATGATTAGGDMLKVLCDNNTKFISGGTATSPSVIKEGLTVGIVGALLRADEVQATVVTVESASSHGTKNKKKKA